MRYAYYIFGVVMLTVVVFILTLMVREEAFTPRETAVWDFTHSRDLSVVNWPMVQKGDKQWASHTRQFKKVTIILPNRPLMISEHPVNVFIEQQGGKIVSIDINEEPVTQKQALDQVYDLAKRWNWPWNETYYNQWARRQNDPSMVSAGDRWLGKKIPYCGASIICSAGTPDRPWYVRLDVEWPEVLPPP